jgi:hypothetical protein
LKCEGFSKNFAERGTEWRVDSTKLKVLFANFPKPGRLDCGSTLGKVESFFAKLFEREGWTAG